MPDIQYSFARPTTAAKPATDAGPAEPCCMSPKAAERARKARRAALATARKLVEQLARVEGMPAAEHERRQTQAGYIVVSLEAIALPPAADEAAA